ncbi:unnamed protein product, partial [Ectocarpus sp. 13 AM-2016]
MRWRKPGPFDLRGFTRCFSTCVQSRFATCKTTGNVNMEQTGFGAPKMTCLNKCVSYRDLKNMSGGWSRPPSQALGTHQSAAGLNTPVRKLYGSILYRGSTS